MAYTPLATVNDLVATPLSEIVRDFPGAQDGTLMVRASRSVETYCERRLAPFTKSETKRVDDYDVEDQDADWSGPLPSSAILGLSRARSMGGASALVRTINLREWPPRWEELWTGSLVSVVAYPPLAGSVTIPTSGIQFEPDIGHMRLSLGTYVPMGSTVVITYTGGYTTVPDDLIQATIFEAIEQAFVWISSERKGDVDLSELRTKKQELLAPYVREQP